MYNVVRFMDHMRKAREEKIMEASWREYNLQRRKIYNRIEVVERRLDDHSFVGLTFYELMPDEMDRIWAWRFRLEGCGYILESISFKYMNENCWQCTWSEGDEDYSF